MSLLYSPCHKCERRAVGCHIACDDYDAWKIEHRKAIEYDKKMHEGVMATYSREMIQGKWRRLKNHVTQFKTGGMR